MFWGLVLEPGKRYSTTVEKSFHVSKAVLDCSSVKSDVEILSVILETEGSESLLCNLCKQKGILQETLDLNFMAGDRLTFECRGHGRVHLSGYLLPDEDDDMSGLMGDEEESEEEEESGWTGDSSPVKSKKEKRKSDQPPVNPSKKKKVAADDEEEEDEDSAEDNESELSDDMEDEDMEDEEDGEDADDDEDEEGDESDEDDDSADEKQKKNKNKTPNKQQQMSPKKTPMTNGMTPKEQKSNKKTPSGGMTPNANITPKQKQTLEGGVVVKEIKAGEGPVAKPGRTVEVYYVGKLKDNGKVFDKQMKGEGFKFKLGKGEVIKGWDIGVQGMKVGGKRVVHCPPGVAYGPKGAPPKIPPNSSLCFEIELRKVY